MIEPILWFFAVIGMLYCLYQAVRLAASAFHRLDAWGSELRVISVRRIQTSYCLAMFARYADLSDVGTYDRLEEMLSEAGVTEARYRVSKRLTGETAAFQESRKVEIIIPERGVPLWEVLNALNAIGGKPERVPAIDYRHAEVTCGYWEKSSSRDASSHRISRYHFALTGSKVNRHHGRGSP